MGSPAFKLNVSGGHFTLRDEDGKLLLTSEHYQSGRSGAMNGIRSIQENAEKDDRYEKKVSEKKQPYFVLKGGNHEIIGTSAMFETDAERDAAIESTKRCAAKASVEDED